MSHMRDDDTYILTPAPAQQAPQGFYGKRSLPTCFILAGIVLVIVAFAVLGAGIFLLADDDAEEDATQTVATDEPTATALVIGITQEATNAPLPSATISLTPTILVLPTSTPRPDEPTATFTLVPPTRIPATHTFTPSHTPTPTATATATQTPTVTLSPTQTQTGIATTIPPSATAVPTSPTISLTPTPTQAQGQKMRLVYDQNSFYMWNTADNQIAMGLLTFEAIDSAGVYAGYRLYGTRWAEFYPYLERGKCAAIEITQSSPWLRPEYCFDYNAILTPQRTYEIVFWLEREGATQFRVLWDDVEIARCPLGNGQCEIFIPN